MNHSTKATPKSIRDLSYYQQRYRNRVFARIVSWIAEQVKNEQISQKDLAERIRKDPALLSRQLKSPSNLTLDTISDLLLAFDAEAEPPEIVRFRDRPQPNFIHPLMARALNVDRTPIGNARSTNVGTKTLRTQASKLRIEVTASAGAG